MAKIKRITKETNVVLELTLSGEGKSEIATGIGFFDHLLELLAFHGCFDLKVQCEGDLTVCGHHSVEDVGMVLGQAFFQEWQVSKDLQRFGQAHIPMDDALASAVVDISGRSFLVFHAEFKSPKVGDFETELVREFFQAFVSHGRINLHLQVLYGENTHHQIEALFKAAAVALRRALRLDSERKGVASTKGKL
ncbi:MAG: imidazoleglycerol-phosphate dehydratase HisB [bacterium]